MFEDVSINKILTSRSTPLSSILNSFLQQGIHKHQLPDFLVLSVLLVPVSMFFLKSLLLGLALLNKVTIKTVAGETIKMVTNEIKICPKVNEKGPIVVPMGLSSVPSVPKNIALAIIIRNSIVKTHDKR